LCYYRGTDSKKVYLVNVRRAISDRKVHAYHRVFVVWGRKPFDGEVVAVGQTKLAETTSNAPPLAQSGIMKSMPTSQYESMELPQGV
jgi:cytochrome c556